MRIAIHRDEQELTSGRIQSFADSWMARLAREGHEARAVDVQAPTFMAQLRDCDGFMWWFAHTSRPRNIGKRLLPAIEHGLGLPVFPSWRTVWHFDDKIAQRYLLEAAGVPIPETHVLWRADDARAFAASARYPCVIKLASGITSENVALLRSRADADYWIDRLFGPGAVLLQRERSPLHPKGAAKRLLNATRVLATGGLAPASTRTDLQRGYLLVQEFLPGNAFDVRVTVIGNRAFAFRRFNRPDDFRASGSGRRDHDPGAIAEDAVAIAFQVARTLGTQSVAVDVLRRDGQPVVTEISYYYEGWLVGACPGHWTMRPGDGGLAWVDGSMAPEDAILTDFLEHVTASRRTA